MLMLDVDHRASARPPHKNTDEASGQCRCHGYHIIIHITEHDGQAQDRTGQEGIQEHRALRGLLRTGNPTLDCIGLNWRACVFIYNNYICVLRVRLACA